MNYIYKKQYHIKNYDFNRTFKQLAIINQQTPDCNIQLNYKYL